jgi:two-component system chemotaxis response regulator CheY
MIGMSGQDVILAVRRLPGGDKVTIIYCTTENEAVDIARALSMGANDYLMKPFDRKSLTAKLAEAPQPAAA